MANEIDSDDAENTESVEFIETVTSRKSKKPALVPAQVENDEPLPLFPNLEKNVRNVITAIRVYKRTPPGDGYKGDVPTTSTLDFIGRRWGDGIYDFEGVNQSHQVLRRTQNVKIDLAGPAQTAATRAIASSAESPGMAEKLLERQSAQHERDADRARSLTDTALATTRSQSEQYAQMVREDSKQRIERDREFFKIQGESQATFFQAMFLQMQQMHTQSMEQQRQGFTQTIQMMQVGHQHTLEQNNPAVLISLFERGLRLGHESAGNEGDPLVSMVQAGVSGLTSLKDMMVLQKGSAPKNLPKTTPKTATPAPAGAPPAREKALSPNEIREVIRLKRIALEKGYVFEDMVRQAQGLLAASEGPEPDESDDAEDESEEEAGASPVAGGTAPE